MRRRSFAALLAGKGPVLGTWLQIPHPETAEIIAAGGFDYAIVDLEHGHFGLERAVDLLRGCDAAGLAPLARVRSIDAIAPVLDAGAVAVVVPGVASAAMARDAVAATRYAPAGTRGACPCVRAGDHFIRDWKRFETATEAGCIALVESGDGIAAIEEIVAVPGLTAVMAGPFDLAVSLGHRGDWRHPAVQRGLDRLIAAAEAVSLPVILPVFDPDPVAGAAQIAAWRARGIRVFTIGTDKILLADAASRWAGLAR
ncbi:HpcH/HpaI aldolase/citrate lyase family protein [Elioraea sp.]|uniref:HpcH/HpaI aldolase family protein n=1 Tax=Elioraea sp. TaxID=2185103 RepID=UPI0025C54182|nr:aldolase/citrate lyase family protein [Elioraea sp.]